MNKKFKSLKKKIILLSLGIILFIAVILCFTLIYEYSDKSADRILININTLEKEITKLRTAEQNFLLNFRSISDLYISSNTSLENEFSSIYSRIIYTIDTLSNLKLLKNDFDINEQIEMLRKNLKFYNDNFQELILIFKEKGAGLIGVVGEWQDISNRMIAKFSEHKDNPIYTNLLKLKTTEKDYLLNRNPGLMDELSVLLDEIQDFFILALEESIELPDISDEMYKYLEKARQLSNLDKRTGFQFDTGIIPDLNSAFREIGIIVASISHLIENKTIASQKSLLIALAVIILILVTGIIVLLWNSFRKYISTPLTIITNYLTELKTGKLPDEKIKLKVNNEFHVLSDSLNTVVDNYTEKLHYTQNINKGALDSELKLLSDEDLFGKELVQLHKNIRDSADEHERYNEENTRRRYINEGLAKFSEILRLYNNDIEKLADTFIKELVKYLNAVQGGFFLTNESDKEKQTLQLISAFAYNRKKYITKEIKIGEGLVGTCAIEKKTINLTEIPKEYISITSGLGDAPPDNLLLLPIIQEDEALGVIELASIKKFQEHEIDIGEQVTASLASTVTTARNNAKTADLLSKSQIQAQEMLEQEEEMRQNMEELKATQEEANRREEEYKGLLDAVDQSTLMVEYDLNGNISKISERFLMFLGKTREELMGKKHANITNTGTKTKVNTQFWNELKKTNSKLISEKYKIGKNREYTMLQVFSTVHNNDGALVKYLNLVADITLVVNNQT